MATHDLGIRGGNVIDDNASVVIVADIAIGGAGALVAADRLIRHAG